jgi:hypothetical protein
MRMLAAWLAVGLAQDTGKEPAFTWKPDAAHVLAARLDGGPEKATERILTTEAEWNEFVKECSGDTRKLLQIKTIDFDKERVLAVSFGPSRSLLTAGETELAGIRGIVEEKERMVVHYTVVTSDKQSDAPSYPVFVVRAPKSEKKTEFKKRLAGFGG